MSDTPPISVSGHFQSVVDILNSNNLTFWVDDGTLLGLVREGHLIESDKDIDISIYCDSIGKLKDLVVNIEELGFTTQIYMYSGLKYIYSFISNDETKRPVHIRIYREIDDISWSPVCRIRDVGKFPQSLFVGIIAHVYKIKRTHVKMDSFPMSLITESKTWVIPSEYYENISSLGNSSIPAPDDYEEYLEFRYGNWRLPDHNWWYWTDDNGLKSVSPDKYLDERV